MLVISVWILLENDYIQLLQVWFFLEIVHFDYEDHRYLVKFDISSIEVEEVLLKPGKFGKNS